MSTERDELAKVIYTSHRGNTQVDLLDNRRLQGSQLAWANLAADTLIASGWRKPQQVTTLEELEALSLPAIIDSPSGGPAKVEYYAGPGRQKYVEPLFCDDEGGDETYSLTFFAQFGLPATVLHVGGAE